MLLASFAFSAEFCILALLSSGVIGCLIILYTTRLPTRLEVNLPSALNFWAAALNLDRPYLAARSDLHISPGNKAGSFNFIISASSSSNNSFSVISFLISLLLSDLAPARMLLVLGLLLFPILALQHLAN